MQPTDLWFIVLIVAVALAFDFMNGFHDAANAIATVVGTRVLRPHHAVMMAAFFNFAAFWIFSLHVAKMIGKGVIDPSVADPVVILAALVGSLTWNIITWYFGIPSSSSHALVGGLAGAALTKAGWGALQYAGLAKIGVSIILSPLIGFVLGHVFMVLVSIIFFRSPPRKIDRWFRRLQLVSASLFSLGHGGNDAQKTMGVITVLLFSTGRLGPEFHVPFWVVISSYFAIAFGTLFGGWRIVKTMGMKITKLRPVGGFCAESAGAFTLFAATGLGIPVSTTHTITGSILGVGAVTSLSAVRWGVAGRIIWAWILTIPASGAIAAVTWYLVSLLFR